MAGGTAGKESIAQTACAHSLCGGEDDNPSEPGIGAIAVSGERGGKKVKDRGW